MSTAKELDKTWDSASVATYGTIKIRVVVLKKKNTTEADDSLPDAPGEDVELVVTGKTPIDSYLERPEHGRQCVVFLVNGQRHDAMDNAFLARDLNFKYLRTRTMVVLDLDGLEQEAIGEIVQGSRQGLYPGNVYQVIKDRLFGTLKNDPDLKRLQEEAEQEISELESGDEAVRKKLDQLIDAHHTAAERATAGEVEPGPNAAVESAAFGEDKKQPVVVKKSPDEGAPAKEPVLTSDSSPSLRLAPNDERTFVVRAQPEVAWDNLELFDVRVEPAVEELTVRIDREARAAKISLRFEEPDDFHDDAYPIEATLSAFARFKGHEEPRLIMREIRVAPKVKRPPPPKPLLLPVPTYLRVATRQPVRLVTGGASTHVRLRWDGQDSLASGSTPDWTFTGRCTSLNSFPPITFSSPRDGQFELLLDAPHGLIPHAQLDFEVVAAGPNDATLKAAFKAEVVEALPEVEPRKIVVVAPETAAQRRPPYDLRYVGKEEWMGTCWDDTDFTEEDVGCYQEPTDTKPLILILNKDTAALRAFRDSMVKHKLEESTIQARLTKYNSHVSFHLYQMYLAQKRRSDPDSDAKPLEAPDLREEINRVGTTLLRLMELSER
jgi:hypothetical protein